MKNSIIAIQPCSSNDVPAAENGPFPKFSAEYPCVSGLQPLTAVLHRVPFSSAQPCQPQAVLQRNQPPRPQLPIHVLSSSLLDISSIMSTIASPREPPRRTPTNSNRPSFETSRSALASPVLTQGPTNPPPPQQQQRKTSSNRAALREYYNLRAAAPRIEIPDSEVPATEIDAPDFNAEEYVAKVINKSSLEELMKLYTSVVGEVRALDAEKKALVYDNYSKLITATETIRKVSCYGTFAMQ